MSKASEYAEKIKALRFKKIAYVDENGELEFIRDAGPLTSYDALCLADWIHDTFGEPSQTKGADE